MTKLTQTREIGRRYRLVREIGEGGMGIVYHAYDRLLGQDVALKLVTAHAVDFSLEATRSISDKTFDFRLALAQEFKTLASLRHPNIISVLDYGFTQDEQPFFTMELLEVPRHIDEATRGLTPRQKVDTVTAMLQALAYLHRRGIIHRDLKPANVLVDRDDRLQVLDFGLSYSTEESTDEREAHEVAGTLAYMAPEMLSSAAPSVKSDLYAAGLIAYQIFAEFYPFALDDVTQLIQDVLVNMPDLSVLQDGLDDVVAMLVAKDPDDRYESAEAAITALLNAAGIPRPDQSQEIRESYLQAAAFVGRQAELTRLEEGVRDALAGWGSAWLIAGESGVGKSRLLAELRTQALIDGVLVVRGQATTEGGAPYQLWRDMMRWLVLVTSDVDDEEAGVARELVPDIERILERPVKPAPAIAPQQARERLLIVFERLLRRQTQPILILLEDLQWALESLEVLKHINQVVHELPVMIVGTYRIDESPKLAETISHDHLLKLDRLDNDEVAQLSAGILGVAGQNDDIVALIQDQTEGNVFFIIEVIRAIVDEVGMLDQVAQKTLPMQVFSGGMQKIIERRLERVPPSARPLLRVAAVYGRELDLAVLRYIAPAVNIDSWLLACSDAAILEIDDMIWRFSHDKLREGVLGQLTPAELATHHRDVAEAIEFLYPDDKDYILPLAIHWRQAGDDAKERDYAVLAGDQLIESFALDEAPEYYRRALELTPEDTPQSLDLLIKLSEVYSLGDFQKAKPVLEQAIELGQKLDAKSSLAEAYANLGRMAMLRDGDWNASEGYLQQALGYIRQTDNKAVLAGVLRQLGNLGIYISDWDIAEKYLQESIQHAEAIDDAYLQGMAINSLSDAYAKRNEGDDHDRAIELSLQTRDIGRDLGHRRLVMMGIAHIGLVALHRQDYALAHQQFEEAYEITRQIRDYEQFGKVANYVGICLLGLHEYDQAKVTFREALGISLDNNSVPEVIRSLTGIALAWVAEGDHDDALCLLALTLNEPRCNTETHALADATYADLQAQFPPERCEALKATGQALSIESVAQKMLETMSF